MVKNLKMTVLIDNIAAEPLVCEWGLSILIEADNRKILLDTGADGQFLQNAGLLGENLAEVDIGVLSHAHSDHADGLVAFFACNDHADFLLREGCRENCFGITDGTLEYIGIRKGLMDRYAHRIRFVSGLHEIADGIWLLPHRAGDYSAVAERNGLFIMDNGSCRPDDFAHEQSLVIETEKGLAVFNSCSHTGMDNILAEVRDMLGEKRIYAYVGGLHLYKMTDEELSVLCDEIRASGIEQILTGHCTGEHAFAFLRQRLDGQIRLFSSGFRCTL